ncbi:hypothetical protein EMIT043CA1_50136 [Pseudomonas brassicacearum]
MRSSRASSLPQGDWVLLKYAANCGSELARDEACTPHTNLKTETNLSFPPYNPKQFPYISASYTPGTKLAKALPTASPQQ